MLLELAIGDAYGSGFAGRYPGDLNHAEDYMPRPESIQPAGHYSGITQMAMSTVESMLTGKAHDIGDAIKWVHRVFRRDRKPFGYVAADLESLKLAKNSDVFHFVSGRNAPSILPRTVCYGIYPKLHKVLTSASAQCSMSHDSESGYKAGLGIALISHFMVCRIGPPKELHKYLHSYLPGVFRSPYSGIASNVGKDVVSCVLNVLMHAQTLSEVLIESVDYLGCCDITAAMAMFCAAANPEAYENDLPSRLYDELEDSKYGKKYLKRLDRYLKKISLPYEIPEEITCVEDT